MRTGGRLPLAPAAAALTLLLSGQAQAAPRWAAVTRAAERAVYAIEVGHSVPLDLIAGYPSWLGTGFQLRLPGGALEEVTACHMVCSDETGQWRAWAQVSLAPLGTAGFLHPAAFNTADTSMYTNADVAESSHVPQRRVTRVAFVPGGDPAVRGALRLGNFNALAAGDPLLVLGNRSGRWDTNGYRPFAQPGTYVGVRANLPESTEGSHWPGTTIPLVLEIAGNFAPGDSGGPVLDAQGHVVAVFVATNLAGTIGYAVPLDPTTGVPVAGSLARKATGWWW